MDMHDEASAREQLDIRKHNLGILETQAARHGADVPLQLQNALDYEREQIRLLEQAFDDFRAGADTLPHIEADDAEIDMADPSPSFGDRTQTQIGRLQSDMAEFRTAVLVKLATIETEIRQMRDEQGRLRNDLAEINDERRLKLQPSSATVIGVIIAIIMAALLFAVLLSLQGAA